MVFILRSLTVCPASVFEAIGHLLAPSGDHEYPEVVESVFPGNTCPVGLVLISLNFDLKINGLFAPCVDSCLLPLDLTLGFCLLGFEPHFPPIVFGDFPLVQSVYSFYLSLGNLILIPNKYLITDPVELNQQALQEEKFIYFLITLMSFTSKQM